MSRALDGRPSLEGSWHLGHSLPGVLIPGIHLRPCRNENPGRRASPTAEGQLHFNWEGVLLSVGKWKGNSGSVFQAYSWSRWADYF